MVPPETIGPLFSARVRIVFTLREHILVISEISIQQRQDSMSEENDLTLEETEGGNYEPDLYYYTIPSIHVHTGDPLSRAPSMRDLLRRIASNTRGKWYLMGLLLNVRQDQLNTITHQNSILCYTNVFSLWEKNADPPFTWGTIVDVLKSPVIGEMNLALDIEGWLKGDQ